MIKIMIKAKKLKRVRKKTTKIRRQSLYYAPTMMTTY